jgi:predicted GNAT family acetyltransferase
VVVVTARALAPGDEAAVEAFLGSHADTTMFLRSNRRAFGLGWSGRTFEGHWAARVDAGGAIAGVVCHAWNGMILVADDEPTAAARAAVAASGRRVTGFSGPPAMVAGARAALGLAGAAAALDDDEVLMALDLARLIVPEALAGGALTCRRAAEGDLVELAGWRHDYHVEALHAPAGDATRRVAQGEVERGQQGGTLWVVEQAGTMVAMTAFNATLPEIVQIGGVYTPPALRRRGFAQAAVAGSLRDARASGVRRAVLFTDRANPSSTGAYARIGFEVTGGYALVLLRESAAADV